MEEVEKESGRLINGSRYLRGGIYQGDVTGENNDNHREFGPVRVKSGHTEVVGLTRERGRRAKEDTDLTIKLCV